MPATSPKTDALSMGEAKPVSAAKTTWAVGGYMLCSATLLIGNKYAVYRVAAPSFILWAQLRGRGAEPVACLGARRTAARRLRTRNIEMFERDSWRIRPRRGRETLEKSAVSRRASRKADASTRAEATA